MARRQSPRSASPPPPVPRTITQTGQFKADRKLAAKSGLDLQKLVAVVDLLQNHMPLAISYRDHSLGGQYAGHRDLHIEPDWVLIYKIVKPSRSDPPGTPEVLRLVRTGSHSQLF